MSLIRRESVLSLLLLALIAPPVHAFVGRVVDAEGRPVVGAEITILGRPGESRTDAEGRFTWTPDPPTPFEILVVAPGGVYMKPVLVERIPEGVLEITVMPLVSEVVTVSGSAASIEATPAAGTTTVTAREMAARAPANLVQALENVAGVNQVSEGHAAVPAVRGLARGRTLILIDGARVTAERRVGASATFLDPDVIEAVEVARGPGSVAYGSDAFGGVVSVRTRTVAPGAPLRARVTLGAGAVIPERRVAAEISRGLDRGSVLLLAHVRDAEDYTSPEGEVFNSGYSNRGVLGRVAYQIGQGLLSAAWQSDFGRDIERPRANSRTVRFYYPTEDSHRFTANYDVRDVAGFSRVLITGFVGRHAQITNQDRFATATSGRSIERADVRANDFQARTNAERRMGRARLELGVDVHGRYGLRALDEFDDYARDGTLVRSVSNVSVDTARRIDAGAYASIDAALTGAISAAAGIRGDRITTRNRGGYFGDRSTAHGAASGFVALSAGSFGGWSATLQLARGFRDPVLSDRYYRGPTGRGFITGNPELDPERSLQLDLSLHYTAPRLRAGVYAYQYRIDDLIERYETEPDFFFFRNRGRARIRGVETELQGTLGGGVTIDAAFQIVRGRALDDLSPLDDMPPETLSLVMRKAFAERNAYVQLRGGFYAEDTRPGPTERVMPGYTLVDAAGGLLILPALELRATARNLLNESYLASPDTRAILAPGRSIGVTAVVRFGGS